MDEIKIDKSFLDKGDRPERDRILLESIIDMIQKLGIKITRRAWKRKKSFPCLKEWVATWYRVTISQSR